MREDYIMAFTSHDTIRGFQQAGISPFNPDVLTDDFIGVCAVLLLQVLGPHMVTV
jgi:hypothetical protein